MKFIWAFLILLAVPAFAQETLPEKGAYVHLNVSSSDPVVQDGLRAVLSFEVRNTSAASAQSTLNATMQSALETAKAVSGMTVYTGAYQTYRNHKTDVWSARQTLTIEGTSKQDMMPLVGKLAEMGLAVTNLQYYIRPETRAKMANALIEKALQEAKTRIDLIARAQGQKTVVLRSLSHHEGVGGPRPYHSVGMARAEAAMGAMPVAEAREETVSVSLQLTYHIF